MINFFESFPDIKLSQELKSIMSYTMVERITTNTAKTRLRIYLSANRLIDKQYFYEVENEIAKQLFGKGVSVEIIEKFELSTQYNCKNLYEAYRESMLLEISKANTIMYQVFRKCDIEFPEDGVIKIILEDTSVSRRFEDEIEDYLHKVFNVRCNMPAKVEVDYKEHSDTQYAKQRDEVVKRMARTIFARANLDEEVKASDAVETAVNATNGNGASGTDNAGNVNAAGDTKAANVTIAANNTPQKDTTANNAAAKTAAD